MKIFALFAGSRFYRYWNSFDTETQRTIIFIILAVVDIAAAYVAMKGLIKLISHKMLFQML